MAVKEKTLFQKFTGKKKTKPAIKMPDKRTMNFVHRKRQFHPKTMIPLILAIVLISCSFVKYGIIDQYTKKISAYQSLSQKQEQLLKTNLLLIDYPDVVKQHSRYSDFLLTEEEINLVDRLEILDLMEKEIAPAAIIENLSIAGNVLTLNISGLTLEQASAMVDRLEGSALVKGASVYSAVAPEAVEASIFMSIILIKEVPADEAV